MALKSVVSDFESAMWPAVAMQRVWRSYRIHEGLRVLHCLQAVSRKVGLASAFVEQDVMHTFVRRLMNLTFPTRSGQLDIVTAFRHITLQNVLSRRG